MASIRCVIIQPLDYLYPQAARDVLDQHWQMAMVWTMVKSGTILNYEPNPLYLTSTYTYAFTKSVALQGQGVAYIMDWLANSPQVPSFIPSNYSEAAQQDDCWVLLCGGLGGVAGALDRLCFVGEAATGPILGANGFSAFNRCQEFFPETNAWQCRYGTGLGTIIHEIGHAAFQLDHHEDHPGEQSVMNSHARVNPLDFGGEFGFLPHQVTQIRQSPFVQQLKTWIPPTITIDTPESWFYGDRINISGRAAGEGALTLGLNVIPQIPGPQSLSGERAWTASWPIELGTYGYSTVIVWVQDASLQRAEATATYGVLIEPPVYGPILPPPPGGPPTLSIISPPNLLETTAQSILMFGYAYADGGPPKVRYTLNKFLWHQLRETGLWHTYVDLPATPGLYTITVVAEDEFDRQTTESIEIRVIQPEPGEPPPPEPAASPPSVLITQPSNNSQFDSNDVFILGRAYDSAGFAFVQVVNVSTGITVQASTATPFWSALIDLQYGENLIVALVVDQDTLLSASHQITLHRPEQIIQVPDTEPPPPPTTAPTIQITTPANGAILTTSTTQVLGTTQAQAGIREVEVQSAGQTYRPGNDASWSVTVPLDPGFNLITAKVTDFDGRTDTDSIYVYREPDSEPPPQPTNISLAITIPLGPIQVSSSPAVVAGVASSNSTITSVTLIVNDSRVVLATGTDEWLTWLDLDEGPNLIIALAADSAGYITQAATIITLVGTPQPPEAPAAQPFPIQLALQLLQPAFIFETLWLSRLLGPTFQLPLPAQLLMDLLKESR